MAAMPRRQCSPSGGAFGRSPNWWRDGGMFRGLSCGSDRTASSASSDTGRSMQMASRGYTTLRARRRTVRASSVPRDPQPVARRTCMRQVRRVMSEASSAVGFTFGLALPAHAGGDPSPAWRRQPAHGNPEDERRPTEPEQEATDDIRGPVRPSPYATDAGDNDHECGWGAPQSLENVWRAQRDSHTIKFRGWLSLPRLAPTEPNRSPRGCMMSLAH